MRQILPITPPQKYVQLLAAKAAYSQLSSEPAIRQALWDQQGGYCAYCERKLRPPTALNHQSRIEHFHPQNGTIWTTDCRLCSNAQNDDEAPTSWLNLLLCCDGNEHLGRQFTCDKLKDNTDICSHFRNPKQWKGANLVSIDREGRAVAVDGLPMGAENVVDKVFNLNADHLIKVRKNIINAWRREVVNIKKKNNGLSPQEISRLADRIRKNASDREYPSTQLSVADQLR